MARATKSKKTKQDTESVETEAVSDAPANGITDATGKKRGKLDANTKSEDKNGPLETFEDVKTEEDTEDVNEASEEAEEAKEKDEPEPKPKTANKRGRKYTAMDKKAKVEEPDEEKEKDEKTNDEPESTDALPEVVTKKGGKKRGKQTGGSNKKKTKPGKEEEEEVGDYEVEKVIDARKKKDGTQEFLIRWKGYSAKDDTWEPEAHLECETLIKEFLEKQKVKENDTGKSTKRGTAKKKEEKEESLSYEVEKIIEFRETSGKREFLIRWKGYKAKDDTWEPEANLSCKKLINEYLEKTEKKETAKTTKRGRTVKSKK